MENLTLPEFFSQTPQAADALLARLKELARIILETNQRMKLTGDEEPELFWRRHIEDALWAAQRIVEKIGPPPADSRILDVGSGGGLPGLVWALLWPQTQVTLLESRRKKTDFLNGAIKALNLANAQAITERAETLGHDPAHREQYDLVTARALASLPTLLELTVPFARVDGHVAAIKSAEINEELKKSQNAIRKFGADVPALLDYTRGDGKPCTVVLVQKISHTPSEYPRRPNLPQTRPIVSWL